MYVFACVSVWAFGRGGVWACRRVNVCASVRVVRVGLRVCMLCVWACGCVCTCVLACVYL